MSPRSLSDIYTVHTTTEQMEQVRAWAVKGAPAGCMVHKRRECRDMGPTLKGIDVIAILIQLFVV